MAICREEGYKIGISSASPCSISYGGVVFINETLLSVCKEQPFVLVRAWIILGFHWTPVPSNPLLVLETLIDNFSPIISQVHLDYFHLLISILPLKCPLILAVSSHIPSHNLLSSPLLLQLHAN